MRKWYPIENFHLMLYVEHIYLIVILAPWKWSICKRSISNADENKWFHDSKLELICKYVALENFENFGKFHGARLALQNDSDTGICGTDISEVKSSSQKIQSSSNRFKWYWVKLFFDYAMHIAFLFDLIGCMPIV